MLLDIKLDKQIQHEEKKTVQKPFKISDVGDLLSNPAYLYIALLCLTFYSAVFPFNAFAPDLLFHKFSMSYELSGRITSLMPLGTMICTPIFGYLIDRYGKAASAMIFGAMTLLFVHMTFTFTYVNPAYPMILLGIAFSLVPAAMWPSMVRLVDDKEIGTAYGLMYSIQNLGLWGFPILAGYILDKSNPGNPETLDYTSTMIMFIALSLLGVFFAFMLKRQDKKGSYGIDLPLNR
jgi:predicted MFS family arabinose efflux permease